MKKNRFLFRFFLPVLLMTLFTSCKKEIMDQKTLVYSTENSGIGGGAVERMLETELLKSVRNATSRFNSTKQAIAAGYQADNHCVSVPGLGGMGYHWVNPLLIDPVFDPLKPEALLYATGPGGNLRLVAVEYIVINTGQARPSFGDHLFDVGGTPVPVAHWSLHVWLYEPNPSGIFVPFNPNISCP